MFRFSFYFEVHGSKKDNRRLLKKWAIESSVISQYDDLSRILSSNFRLGVPNCGHRIFHRGTKIWNRCSGTFPCRRDRRFLGQPFPGFRVRLSGMAVQFPTRRLRHLTTRHPWGHLSWAGFPRDSFAGSYMDFHGSRDICSAAASSQTPIQLNQIRVQLRRVTLIRPLNPGTMIRRAATDIFEIAI